MRKSKCDTTVKITTVLRNSLTGKSELVDYVRIIMETRHRDVALLQRFALLKFKIMSTVVSVNI